MNRLRPLLILLLQATLVTAAHATEAESDDASTLARPLPVIAAPADGAAPDVDAASVDVPGPPPPPIDLGYRRQADDNTPAR